MEDRFRFKFAINNKVYDVYEIDFGNESISYNNDSVMFEGDLNKGRLLQCTELKDKNGNLIYEGDIILHKNGKKYEVKHGYFDVDINDEYATNCYGWHFDGYLDEYEQISNCSLRLQIEVIGNIHENPELLEKEE